MTDKMIDYMVKVIVDSVNQILDYIEGKMKVSDYTVKFLISKGITDVYGYAEVEIVCCQISMI